MNLNFKPRHLTLLILGASAAGFALRKALYAFGFDGRGLLIENHPAALALWGLTAAVAILLILFALGAKTELTASSTALGAAGAFAAAAALGYTAMQEFGNFFSIMDILLWALGLSSAICFALIGICRLRRSKPYFLLHALPCVYLALRMVTRYRMLSIDPQLMDYCFYLCACVALMLTAYHHAALDAGMGKPKLLRLYTLGSVYLSCVALSYTEDPLLLAGLALWAVCSLPREARL